MAYIGFSLPVITTGALIDAVGHVAALTIFGLALSMGAITTIGLLLISQARYSQHPSGISF